MENRAGDYPPGELPVASCLFFGGRVEVHRSSSRCVKLILGGKEGWMMMTCGFRFPPPRMYTHWLATTHGGRASSNRFHSTADSLFLRDHDDMQILNHTLYFLSPVASPSLSIPRFTSHHLLRLSHIITEAYMDYDKLKAIIKELSAKKLSRADSTTREVSLTAPPPTNAAGMLPFTPGSNVTEEDFYSCIDSNLHKVEQFTLQRVTLLRTEISAVEKAVASMGETPSAAEKERCMALANNVADAFLTLEKYVNINFMGFHKILKKHDKNFPAYSCKQFYIYRMHNQAWVRGDYSDVVVRLSSIYATVRDDHVAEEKGGGAQAFSRSTTKYWVRTEDVSKVKYAVLKHLPVFLQKTSTGESDSQFTNSVYFDNDQMGE